MGNKGSDYIPKDLKKVKNFNVKLTEQDFKKLRKIASKRNMTMSYIARELIVEFINKPDNGLN